MMSRKRKDGRSEVRNIGRIRTGAVEKRGEGSVRELVLLLAGIYSILLILRAVPHVTFFAAAAFPAVTAVCIGLYGLFRIRKKLVWAGTAGILLVCAVLGAVRRDLCTAQLGAFAAGLTDGSAQGEESVTFLILLAGSVLSVCFFLFEIVWKRHWLPYILVTGVMAGAPVFGIRPGFIPVFLGLVFQVLFWAIHTAGRRVSGEEAPVQSGNNYRTGEPQMEVTLQEKPEETLYLKGFTGGAYTGGGWEPADDGAIFHEMSAALGWEGWESWISGQFSSLYYAMNMISSEEGLPPRYLFIRHIDESYETLFMPYYSGWVGWTNSEEPGYGFQYYEGNEMDISWERSVPAEYRRARLWLWELQDTYMQGMPEIYTQVDEALVPRLSELCSGRASGSVDDTTAFILSTLRSDASYTLTPGRAPLNEDIVEYFLFENHEGYCVHFASAATLMYRLCGIPARYAAGYAIEPGAFVRQDDGTWRAEVTDESAHAWTEIFLENYEWTPVEVTHSSDGSYSTFYPGLDTERLAEMLSAADFAQAAPAEMRTSEGIGTDEAEEGFAEALSAQIPCLSSEEAERLTGTASRSAYGREGPGEEENEFAREIYFRTEKWIEKELKGLRRLRFKYLRGM